MPAWVSVVLVLSHIAVFILGALAYHGIRILASRPLYPSPTQRPGMTEAKLKEIAQSLAKKQASEAMFGNFFDRFAQMPTGQRETYVPQGDGKPAGETFAPSVAGGKRQ